MLLKSGATVEAIDASGATALIIAIENAKFAVIELLFEHVFLFCSSDVVSRCFFTHIIIVPSDTRIQMNVSAPTAATPIALQLRRPLLPPPLVLDSDTVVTYSSGCNTGVSTPAVSWPATPYLFVEDCDSALTKEQRQVCKYIQNIYI